MSSSYQETELKDINPVMSLRSGTPALTTTSIDTQSSPESDGKATSYSTGRASPAETIIAHPGSARPTHYLGRGYGKFTPLIALDELPSDIKIDGLSLSMTFAEVVQVGGQLCMPAVEMAKDKYTVIQESKASRNDVTDSKTSTAVPDHSEATNVPSSLAINTRLARALDGVGPSTDPEKLKKALLQLKNQKSTPANQRYNPTTPGVLGQKVYCTHWMRTGECDFTQQGCMFLHAMPDLDTLELLGFRSYPRWFREMPRQYQLQNATDFDEIGLDQHRHGRNAGNSDGWHNQGNKYTANRGPMSQGFSSYSQQPFLPMPGSAEAPQHRQINGPWRSTGFIQSQPPAMQASSIPYGSMSYDRSFIPLGLPHQHANQQHYSVGEHNSVWSRDTSPNIGVINRLHKPLSPEITSSYPIGNLNINGSSNRLLQPSQSMASPPRSITSGPNQRAANTGNRPANGNPKTSLLFRANGRDRGGESRRGRSSSPRTTQPAKKNLPGSVSAKSTTTVIKTEEEEAPATTGNVDAQG